MAAPTLALVGTLVLLGVDAVIEMGFVTSMVSYLHNSAPSALEIETPARLQSAVGDTYILATTPRQLLVDQGHTSNGAAGTALVLIVLLGALVLSARYLLRHAAAGSAARALARGFYYLWLALQVPALLLTVGALAYVFAVTNKHRGQVIDQQVAAQSSAGEKYPLDQWTPQNWFAAVTTQLRFVDAGVRSDLVRHLRIMRGWQYNLIPLFLVQLAATVAAFLDWRRWRNYVRHAVQPDFEHKMQGRL